MLNSNLVSFDSKLEVEVIDRTGKPAGLDRGGKPITRTLINAPLTHLFPNEPIVFINWLWGKKEHYRLQASELEQAVDGFSGKWAWGSAVKRGLTIGLKRDLLVESGLGKKAEDGQRVGRWLLANCQYGAATGHLRIKLVKPGELFNGLPVEDGFGYVKQSVADIIDQSRTARKFASPEDANDSFHVWQRIAWTPAVAAESLPRLQEAIDGLSTRALEYHMSAGMQDKKALYALDKAMLLHPYVANSLTRSEKAMALRLATSVPTNSKVRVAVPTTAKQVAANGKVILTGYPIDAWGSIRALDVECGQNEIDRIAAMETAQYTLANERMMAKGMLGILADELLGDYDLILCKEDVKMAQIGVDKFRAYDEVELTDAFLGFIMRYAAGTAIGIEAKLWKAMGRDFDGDHAIVTDCADKPALYAAVADFPEQETVKLKKTHSSFEDGDKRPAMIEKSMLNIVGFATNVAALTFCVADRAFLASQLGYRDGEVGLDNALNYFIKVGTDLFKVEVDVAKVEKQLGVLQSNLTRLLSRGAPWCKWGRDDWAFVHGIPMPYDKSMGNDTDDPIVRNSVPRQFDGTIALIARYALPQLEGAILTPIEARPLNEFIHWASPQSEELSKKAGELQIAFNQRVTSVNFTDFEDVEHFRAWWESEITGWLKQGVNPKNAAQAMWRAAHSSRSLNAGAASVFYGFPEESRWIVTEKPGHSLTAKMKTVLLGLKETVEAWTGNVRIVEFREVHSGKTFIRKAVVLDAPDLMLGDKAVIPMDSDAPDKGAYLATIRRRSNKSWLVEFVAA